jgi:hypothetical protein
VVLACAPSPEDAWPPGTPQTDVVIASPSEPGERLALTGVLRNARGRPVPGGILRVYHSDAHGTYMLPGQNVPRLAARIRTGPHGEFRIRTIVPSSDNSLEPPHLHFEILSAGSRVPAVRYLIRDSSAVRESLPARDVTEWTPERTRRPVAGRPDAVAIARDSTGVWVGEFELRVP